MLWRTLEITILILMTLRGSASQGLNCVLLRATSALAMKQQHLSENQTGFRDPPILRKEPPLFLVVVFMKSVPLWVHCVRALDSGQLSTLSELMNYMSRGSAHFAALLNSLHVVSDHPEIRAIASQSVDLADAPRSLLARSHAFKCLCWCMSRDTNTNREQTANSLRTWCRDKGGRREGQSLTAHPSNHRVRPLPIAHVEVFKK
jgi:hypothetical protein